MFLKEMCRSFRSIAKLGTLVVLMGLIGLLSSSPAIAQTNTGLIAYTSNANVSGGNPEGDHEIWIMNGDGTNKRQLTFNNVNDHAPDISLDGTKIVFLRDGVNANNQTINQLWTMSTNGSNQTYVPTTYYFQQPTDLIDQPRWSPDGSKIAYGGTQSSMAPRFWQCFTYIVATGAVSPTPSYMNITSRDDVQPTWSPDGSCLAYVRHTWSAPDSFSNRITYQDLMMTDPSSLSLDGPKVKSLSVVTMMGVDPTRMWQPVFSRNGSTILYSDVSAGTPSASTLRVINLSGTNVQNYGSGFHPGYNSDGTKIVASSARYKDSISIGYGSIYTMNVNGTGSSTIATGIEPSWGRMP